MAVYQGNAGPDSFRGGTTDDSIYGRQGNDTLIGGGGNDLIYGGMDNDAITVGGAVSRSLIYGGEGGDTVTSLGGVNTMLGGTGVQSIDPNDGADFIDARADGAGDLILGNGGADTILGSTVAGSGFGQDLSVFTQIFGGMGADVISFGVNATTAPVILAGNEDSDSITTSSTASTVYGGQGDDAIRAAASGNDLIFGGEGADTINVLGGNNTILGGTGVQSIDATSVDGGDLITFRGLGLDAASSERFILNDILLGITAGSVGNDIILGNAGDDTIVTLAQAVGGSDTLVGGQGNDIIVAGGQVNDLILGNEGNDTIITTYNNFSATLNFLRQLNHLSPENLGAPTGNVSLYGGQGDDVVNAGNTQSISNDLIFGGEGNDSISDIGGGSNTIYGGIDSVGSGDGSNFIDISGVTSQTGSASVLRELVYGGSGMDAVSVGSAIDAVTISGNGGTNQYAFTANSVSGATVGGAGSGLDQITDFISGADKFLLNSVGGAKLTVNSVFGAGSESGQANLTAAANAALLTASIQGANAATFSYGGSNFLAVDGGNGGGFQSANDILINIAGTTSLTKNDFV